jgi:hypothetical protein
MYHYTSIDVLMKIVESTEMWASNAFYMNDASEIRHGIEVVQQRAAARFGSGSKADDAEFLRHLVGWVANQRPRTFPFFVACFSEKRDDLNQWRAYASGPRGVCIGFDNSQLHDCFREQNWDFMHVYYHNRTDQSGWADAFITRAAKAVAALEEDAESRGTSVPPQQRDERYYWPAFESVIDVLLEVASRIKHPKFAEEREWRLTSRLVTKARPAEIRYRVGGSMMIPYVPFKLVPRDASALRFADVIIPQTSTADLARASLQDYLGARGVTAQVVVSAVPFRQL